MADTPTHFERLGLPARFALDLDELERNYLARSRAIHPDYHQLSSSSEQRVSQELTAALNEAYATLRQPFRAEYLLALQSGPSAAEMKEMAPAFLEEMLELRMEIEELRESGPVDSPGRLAMEKQLTRRSEALIAELKQHFGRLEGLSSDDPTRRGTLVKIRQALKAAKYVQGLLRDLRAD